MPAEQLKTSTEETPLSIFLNEIEQIETERDALQEQSAELQQYLANNNHSIEQVNNRQNQAVQNFFENLSEAPELYRAIFEIIIGPSTESSSEDKEWCNQYSLLTLKVAESKAEELSKLNSYMEELEQPEPLMLLSTKDHELVSNPSNLSYPSESDLRRNRVTGVNATIARIEPGSAQNVDCRSNYHPSQGRLTVADKIYLSATNVTTVQTSLRGFDHDVWLEKPKIDEADRQNIVLLEPKHQAGVTSSISVSCGANLSGDREKILPSKNTDGHLYIGKICISNALEALHDEAEFESYDTSAIKIITNTFEDKH